MWQPKNPVLLPASLILQGNKALGGRVFSNELCIEFSGPFSLRPSAHGATQNKLIGHANYQPVTSELLPF